jgi:hypothetical protein
MCTSPVTCSHVQCNCILCNDVFLKTLHNSRHVLKHMILAQVLGFTLFTMKFAICMKCDYTALS